MRAKSFICRTVGEQNGLRLELCKGTWFGEKVKMLHVENDFENEHHLFNFVFVQLPFSNIATFSKIFK